MVRRRRKKLGENEGKRREETMHSFSFFFLNPSYYKVITVVVF
jgi:hypothetical protein